MSNSMKFVATGDSFITRRLPCTHDKEFQRISNIINKGEFRFTNFEVTAHRFEGFPAAESGGTWAIADPSVIKDIKKYGFNILAWANNHTLDYSYGGLKATTKYLDNYGLIHAGVGRNLAEASAPKYLECSSGRVALIAVTSTFHESWIAGEQRPDMQGRPGINPLRIDTKHVISKDNMEQLKTIADITGINSEHNLLVKEGFATSNEQTFKFGKYDFIIGSEEGKVTTPLATDMDRIIKTIEEAKRQADYVIVSIHSHEMEGESKHKPAQFLKEFSRKCIDNGAHAIIGHGPHILRGIEIYKNRPIFYSIGNFIFQNNTVSNLPHDFYTKYGMGFEHNVGEALNKRSENGQKGLDVNPAVWESVIPYWKMKNGKLEELIVYPIELGFDLPNYRKGWPKVAQSTDILNSLIELSKPFGTNIEIKNNVGIIKC